MAAPKKTQFPDLPGSTSTLFCIAVILRKFAQREALERVRTAEYKKRKENCILTFALTRAIMEHEGEIGYWVDHAKESGLLPFAWSGTTALQGGAA